MSPAISTNADIWNSDCSNRVFDSSVLVINQRSLCTNQLSGFAPALKQGAICTAANEFLSNELHSKLILEEGRLLGYIVLLLVRCSFITF